MAGMLFGMDTGIIGGVIVLPAFTQLVPPTHRQCCTLMLTVAPANIILEVLPKQKPRLYQPILFLFSSLVVSLELR